MNIMIGSVALKHQLEKWGIRANINPKDIDIISPSLDDALALVDRLKSRANTFKSVATIHSKKFKTTTFCLNVDGTMVEISAPTVEECSTQLMIASLKVEPEAYLASQMELLGEQFIVPSLNFLYTLKFSHRFLRNSPSFNKTMVAINNLKRLPGIKTLDWLEARQKETYDYEHPILTVSKKNFFNDSFKYVYDHDSIHEAVKIDDTPAYVKYKKGEVQCESTRFFACSRTVQLLGVLEEAYVLALERSQIPSDFKDNPYESFKMALEKICTSITSGWFRQFAWENYNDILKMYDGCYVDKFKFALANGNILPHGG